MKHIIILILIPLAGYSQQWYSMGNLDTLGNTNGNKAVNEICFYNNKITIGGNFKKENSSILNGISQWNGTNWEPMGIGVWWQVTIDSSGNGGGGLVEYKNSFYVAGVFTGAGGSHIGDSSHIAGYITKWNGTDWNPLSGAFPPYSGFNSSCLALKVYHNNLYAGGYFGGSWDATGAHTTNGISKWNDTIFSAVGQMSGDFPPNYDFPVLDLCVYNNKLIAGGEFTSIDGSAYGTYSGIASWDDTSWGALGAGFNDAVWALTVFNGELYAGGQFTATRDNLTQLNHIAKWNGTQWSAVGEGLNDTVLTLTVDSLQNKLYAGGAFTQTGLGVSAKHIAEWTGSNWQEVGGGTNNDVYALFAKDSNLYVGGTFTKAGTVQASLIARWGFNTTVGIVDELGIKNEELGIYPNPASTEFTIDTRGIRIKEIKITNALGQVIKTINNTQTVDITDISNGIYFIQIKTDGSAGSPQGRIENKKLIKQ